MSNDIYHQEIYTHKSGKKYHVAWYYDHDFGSPLENGDGYGVTERMDWNPTDEEQLEQHLLDYEPELEEETRLRLMRQLCRPSNRYDSGLYYDALSSLHKAKTEWGIDDPVKAMEVVEKDFAYLKGWYDDDWFWLTVGVAPLDEDGEPGAPPEKLSKRQKQLLVMLDKGLSNRDIAEELQISEHTVKVHLWRLFRRLNVKSRSQASHLARTQGLV